MVLELFNDQRDKCAVYWKQLPNVLLSEQQCARGNIMTRHVVILSFVLKFNTPAGMLRSRQADMPYFYSGRKAPSPKMLVFVLFVFVVVRSNFSLVRGLM